MNNNARKHEYAEFSYPYLTLWYFFRRMTMSSKATLALLIYGIITQYSALCSPAGLQYPKIRYVNMDDPSFASLSAFYHGFFVYVFKRMTKL